VEQFPGRSSEKPDMRSRTHCRCQSLVERSTTGIHWMDSMDDFVDGRRRESTGVVPLDVSQHLAKVRFLVCEEH
jgi:hypothetical protein